MSKKSSDQQKDVDGDNGTSVAKRRAFLGELAVLATAGLAGSAAAHESGGSGIDTAKWTIKDEKGNSIELPKTSLQDAWMFRFALARAWTDAKYRGQLLTFPLSGHANWTGENGTNYAMWTARTRQALEAEGVKFSSTEPVVVLMEGQYSSEYQKGKAGERVLILPFPVPDAIQFGQVNLLAATQVLQFTIAGM